MKYRPVGKKIVLNRVIDAVKASKLYIPGQEKKEENARYIVDALGSDVDISVKVGDIDVLVKVGDEIRPFSNAHMNTHLEDIENKVPVRCIIDQSDVWAVIER